MLGSSATSGWPMECSTAGGEVRFHTQNWRSVFFHLPRKSGSPKTYPMFFEGEETRGETRSFTVWSPVAMVHRCDPKTPVTRPAPTTRPPMGRVFWNGDPCNEHLPSIAPDSFFAGLLSPSGVFWRLTLFQPPPNVCNSYGDWMMGGKF